MSKLSSKIGKILAKNSKSDRKCRDASDDVRIWLRTLRAQTSLIELKVSSTHLIVLMLWNELDMRTQTGNRNQLGAIDWRPVTTEITLSTQSSSTQQTKRHEQPEHLLTTMGPWLTKLLMRTNGMIFLSSMALIGQTILMTNPEPSCRLLISARIFLWAKMMIPQVISLVCQMMISMKISNPMTLCTSQEGQFENGFDKDGLTVRSFPSTCKTGNAKSCILWVGELWLVSSIEFRLTSWWSTSSAPRLNNHVIRHWAPPWRRGKAERKPPLPQWLIFSVSFNWAVSLLFALHQHLIHKANIGVFGVAGAGHQVLVGGPSVVLAWCGAKISKC